MVNEAVIHGMFVWPTFFVSDFFFPLTFYLRWSYWTFSSWFVQRNNHSIGNWEWWSEYFFLFVCYFFFFFLLFILLALIFPGALPCRKAIIAAICLVWLCTWDKSKRRITKRIKKEIVMRKNKNRNTKNELTVWN